MMSLRESFGGEMNEIVNAVFVRARSKRERARRAGARASE